MGAYLRKPVTAKVSSQGDCIVSGRRLVYAYTAMQGWRVTMEDAHSVIPDLGDETSLFAVYDGHGGREVADYCATHLAGIITASEAYKSGDIEAALKESFMHCDRQLLTEEVIVWLKKHIMPYSDEEPEDDSGDEEEASRLLEEADMPLENLLAQYTDEQGNLEDFVVDSSNLSKLSATPPSQQQEGPVSDGPGKEQGEGREGRVRSMLQMLASRAGIQIGFAAEGEEGEEEEGEVEEDSSEGSEYEGDSREEEEEGDERPMEEEEPPATGSKDTVAPEADEKEDSMESSSSSSEGTRTACPEAVGGCPRGERGEGGEGSACGCEVAGSVVLRNEKEAGEEGCGEETTCEEKIGISCNSDSKDEIAATAKSEPVLEQDRSAQDGEAGGSEPSAMEGGGSKPSDMKGGSEGESVVSEDVGSSSDLPLKTESSSRNGDAGDRFFMRDNSQRSHNPCLVNLLTSALEDRENSTPVGLESPDAVTADEGARERNFKPAELIRGSPVQLRPRKRPRVESPEDLEELLEETSPKKPCKRIADEGYHSGTTAVLCLLRNKELYVSNAGDSRCVLSINGMALDMSQDHKPTDAPELLRIEKAGGKVGMDSRVNGGLNLSRAIGDHFYKENKSLPLEEQMITAMPEVQRRTLTGEEDFFVVACDGIWNSKSSQEVVDFVKARLSKEKESSTQLVQICEALCDACLAPDTDNDGTGCDNMTCILVVLQPVDSQ